MKHVQYQTVAAYSADPYSVTDLQQLNQITFIEHQGWQAKSVQEKWVPFEPKWNQSTDM